MIVLKIEISLQDIIPKVLYKKLNVVLTWLFSAPSLLDVVLGPVISDKMLLDIFLNFLDHALDSEN